MHANDRQAKTMEWILYSGQIRNPLFPIRRGGILNCNDDKDNVRCNANVKGVVTFVVVVVRNPMSASPHCTNREKKEIKQTIPRILCIYKKSSLAVINLDNPSVHPMGDGVAVMMEGDWTFRCRRCVTPSFILLQGATDKLDMRPTPIFDARSKRSGTKAQHHLFS